MLLTASDLKILVRLASDLPGGATDRRKILSGFKRSNYKDRWLAGAAKGGAFHFRNQASADLWANELIGQISDGMWENSPNTGWQYWANLPVLIGGSTKLEGGVPGGIKNSFNFTNPDLLDAVGQEMLKEVQKSEPNATMGDVIRYLKEIKSAMKGAEISNPVAPSGSTGVAASLPDEVDQRLAHFQMMKVCFDVAGLPKVSLQQIEAEAFLFASTGSRAGQYHYFVILSNGAVCSAYGKFGRVPKGVLLGNTYDVWEQKKLISQKAKSKISSGYDISNLAGIRKLLDPITGKVTHQGL